MSSYKHYYLYKGGNWVEVEHEEWIGNVIHSEYNIDLKMSHYIIFKSGNLYEHGLMKDGDKSCYIYLNRRLK